MDQEAKPPGNTETALFGAGCFWGVEEAFRKLHGVLETSVGYTGGTLKNPSYEDVCNGDTGHAEVVRVVFDPSQISYDKLLEVFWDNHNPTTLNRQGPDVGSQYRSVIFTENDEQKQLAEESKQQLEVSGKWKKSIVTDVVPAQTFYPAEDYHQNYLLKRGMDSCHY